jgi:hypothetical protein
MFQKASRKVLEIEKLKISSFSVDAREMLQHSVEPDIEYV